MLGPTTGSILPSVSPSRVLLLRGEQATSHDENLRRLLDFFAIPWKVVTASGKDVEVRARG